ncbi:MAG: serine protease [Planctomycetia bacterium]|nr:serine protease [Planctomycetia bacterium]
MPTWSGILEELAQSRPGDGPPQFDAVRRKYLVLLRQHTGREVILYASKWTQHDPSVSPDVISIVDEDLQGIMEVIHGLSGPSLDLILHSPGGSPEAAEALVNYLRSKFFDIRVIVPQLAMSAATMIACAANSIVLGKHSFLGPTDPQFIVNTPLGTRMVPAQAILEQFDLAQSQCGDAAKLGAWLPMLGQYGPDLLVQCQNASAMSKELVQTWLKAFMFREWAPAEAEQRAASIAEWLSSHRNFLSHSRHIPRDECESKGLLVEHLESDQRFQDLVLSVFHAATHTFNGTGAVKIIENHLGKAFIKQSHAVVVQMPGAATRMTPFPPMPPEAGPVPRPKTPTSAKRRRKRKSKPHSTRPR